MGFLWLTVAALKLHTTPRACSPPSLSNLNSIQTLFFQAIEHFESIFSIFLLRFFLFVGCPKDTPYTNVNYTYSTYIFACIIKYYYLITVLRKKSEEAANVYVTGVIFSCRIAETVH